VRWIICSTNEGLRISQTSTLFRALHFDRSTIGLKHFLLCNCNDSKPNTLYLETARLTLTTSLLKLASLAPDIGFDAIIRMRIVNGGSLTEVSQRRTALRSTEQDSVGSGRCSQGKLVECDALTTGGNDALTGILSEGDGTDAHLGAFKHANIIGDFANNDSNLALFLRHVFGKAVEAHGRSVHLRHVQTLGDGSAKFRFRSAGEEFVKLNEEASVGILCLDDFHRRLVARSAAAGFQIDTHCGYLNVLSGWICAMMEE
jgi:hypothetical protein